MYLTVHAALGMLVGQQTDTPAFAFAGGFISHLLIDIIPHGDTPASGIRWTTKRILIAGAVDGLCMVGMVWYGIAQGMWVLTPAMLAGILGAISPDILQIPYYISKGAQWKRYIAFHNFFHNSISNYFEFLYPVGLAVQLCFLSLFITLVK